MKQESSKTKTGGNTRATADKIESLPSSAWSRGDGDRVRVSLCGLALDLRTHAHLVEISLQSLIAGKVNSEHPTLFSLFRNNGNVPA
jgi:hypothetical protein